jgi:hypothetical protein
VLVLVVLLKEGLLQTVAATRGAFSSFDCKQLLTLLLQQAVHQQSSSSSSMKLSEHSFFNLCWSVAVPDLQRLASSVVELVRQANKQQQWVDFAPKSTVSCSRCTSGCWMGSWWGSGGLAGAAAAAV